MLARSQLTDRAMQIVKMRPNQLVGEFVGFRSGQIASMWITHNASCGFGFRVIGIYTGQDPLASPISKITLMDLQGLESLPCDLFLIVILWIDRPRPTSMQLLI